jgi:hypothetical protein
MTARKRVTKSDRLNEPVSQGIHLGLFHEKLSDALDAFGGHKPHDPEACQQTKPATPEQNEDRGEEEHRWQEARRNTYSRPEVQPRTVVA